MHVHKHKSHLKNFLFMFCFPFSCLTNCHLRHVDCYVMLANLFWWCWRFVFELCSLCKPLLHSHTMLQALSNKCHHDHLKVYLKCRTCHFHHLTVLQSVTLSICCLDWFEISYLQVMLSVCSQGHACLKSLVHTLSHFAEAMSTWPTSTVRSPLSCTAQFQPSMNM